MADSSCIAMPDPKKVEQYIYGEASPFWVSVLLVILLAVVVELILQRWYSPDKVASLSPEEIITRSPDVFGNVAARVRAANSAATSNDRDIFIFGGSTVMAALVGDADLEGIADKKGQQWGLHNLALPSLMLDEAVYLSNKLNFQQGDVVVLAADLGRFNQGRRELVEKFSTYPEVMFSDPSRSAVIGSLTGLDAPGSLDRLLSKAILPRLYANFQNHIRRCFSVNALGNFRPQMLIEKARQYMGGAKFCDSYDVFFNDEMFKARKVLSQLQIDTAYPKTLFPLNKAYELYQPESFAIFKSLIANLKVRDVTPVIYFPPKSEGYFQRWGRAFDQHLAVVVNYAEGEGLPVIDHSRDYLDQDLYSDFSHFNRPLGKGYSEHLIADIAKVLN